MPNIFITGSEGNIGSFLVDYILKQKPQINLITTSRSPNQYKSKKETKKYIGDLTDKQFVKKIFTDNKIDYVIHAAAYPYSKEGFEKPYSIIANDQQCILNVLDYSKYIKKIIYISSILVYELCNKFPFEEKSTDEIAPPKSPYGIAKYFGEKAVLAFHKQTGVPYTIWRPYNVVSPLESHEKDGGHVFVDFYRKIFVEQTDKLPIYGSGKQVRCFTWVMDLAQEIIDFLDNEKTNNQIFNIGSEEEKTLLDLKDVLITIGKEKKYLPMDYRPAVLTGDTFYGIDTAKRIASIEKIKKLGWKPKTNFKECFEKFIDYKQKYAKY